MNNIPVSILLISTNPGKRNLLLPLRPPHWSRVEGGWPLIGRNLPPGNSMPFLMAGGTIQTSMQYKETFTLSFFLFFPCFLFKLFVLFIFLYNFVFYTNLSIFKHLNLNLSFPLILSTFFIVVYIYPLIIKYCILIFNCHSFLFTFFLSFV